MKTATCISTLTLALAALALASCAVGPDYKRPETPAPAAFKSATPDPGAQTPDSSPAIATDWWTLFDDPELTQLITECLAANPAIDAAMARVDQARALAKAARAGFYPALTLSPSASRSRAPSSRSFAAAGSINNNFTLPLDLSYEIDIWGKLRRAGEAARAGANASAADYAVVRQATLAELAQDYFLLRLYDTQIAILAESTETYRRQVELTRTKQRAGLALQSDVLLAQTQLDDVIRQQLEARRSREKTEHAIAILAGTTPDQLNLPPRNLPTAIPLIPAGLPATLLARRPDVAAAEQTLIAANAGIGVAKAQLYPSINLTGALGYESNALDTLTSWSNRIWSIAGGIAAPVFEGGRLRAGVEQSEAVWREQLANYRSAVLTAFQDVEDTLTDLHLLADESTLLDQTVKNATENVRLIDIQYRQGLVSNLDVLTVNQALLSARLNAAQTNQQRLSATILLIKALGGGWNSRSRPSGRFSLDSKRPEGRMALN